MNEFIHHHHHHLTPCWFHLCHPVHTSWADWHIAQWNHCSTFEMHMILDFLNERHLVSQAFNELQLQQKQDTRLDMVHAMCEKGVEREPKVYMPLARYIKLQVAHAPGMLGTFFPPPRVSDPDMHHDTCVTHVPWCMPRSLTNAFVWSRWRENVPGIPGACATRNFTYLNKGPCRKISHNQSFPSATCLAAIASNDTGSNLRQKWVDVKACQGAWYKYGVLSRLYLCA